MTEQLKRNISEFSTDLDLLFIHDNTEVIFTTEPLSPEHCVALWVLRPYLEKKTDGFFLILNILVRAVHCAALRVLRMYLVKKGGWLEYAFSANKTNNVTMDIGKKPILIYRKKNLCFENITFFIHKH